MSGFCRDKKAVISKNETGDLQSSGHVIMTMTSCGHITEYKSKYGTNQFRIIHAYFIAASSDNARRRKVYCLFWQSHWTSYF